MSTRHRCQMNMARRARSRRSCRTWEPPEPGRRGALRHNATAVGVVTPQPKQQGQPLVVRVDQIQALGAGAAGNGVESHAADTRPAHGDHRSEKRAKVKPSPLKISQPNQRVAPPIHRRPSVERHLEIDVLEGGRGVSHKRRLAHLGPRCKARFRGVARRVLSPGRAGHPPGHAPPKPDGQSAPVEGTRGKQSRPQAGAPMATLKLTKGGDLSAAEIRSHPLPRLSTRVSATGNLLPTPFGHESLSDAPSAPPAFRVSVGSTAEGGDSSTGNQPPAAFHRSACATPVATQLGRIRAGAADTSGTAGPLTWTGAVEAVSGGDRNHLAKVRVAGFESVVRSKKVQVTGL